ncbi:M23 family metallopeptidase [Paucibacter sp. APW11]|uniref:M23 family metallopeptidase n=1 Tax=Roseateles aquae TaxID=3077235 RepID=A0ABU3PFL0_9BURK|nr:M23 family metallopeptidase [Paucibacter sp. APW11]MDT9000706.1 M23 family metallopeptidase [Paucibacter sp. APW11]
MSELDRREHQGAAISWLELPLRGAWAAWRTPAECVPSHGVDRYGQRYAYDFVRLDDELVQPHRASPWRAAFGGVQARDFLAWEQPVLAPLAGDVVAVGEGWPDHLRVHQPWQALRERFWPARPSGADWRPLVGNYLLLRSAVGYLLCAHLREGSLRLRVGDSVNPGDEMAAVGNSGQSSMPHLHLQLMDGPDLHQAGGRLCGFRRYERLSAGQWLPVRAGLPERLQQVRSLAV